MSLIAEAWLEAFQAQMLHRAGSISAIFALSMAKNKPIVFFAYPSNPPHIGETIENLSKAIRLTGSVDIRTWKDMEVAGLRITKQILRKIDQCDIFACDLTYLNNNVLFELGYAIARRKKIFPTLDVTTENAHKRYISLSPLASIGYIGYQNSHDLHSKFFDSKIIEKSYESLADHLRLFEFSDPFGIFYLKSAANSDASSQVTEAISDFPFRNITDDPQETPTDSLIWYTMNVEGCRALLAHFMSTEQVGHTMHNLKVSLVAGMTLGRNKRTVLLAQEPFDTPSDLPDFIKTHSTASHARSIARSALVSMRDDDLSLAKSREAYRTAQQKNRNLRNINLGQYLAENENADLYKYFVETGAYNEIIGGRQTIFIGRKGMGKTANLFAATDHFRSDKRNLVVVIKPVGYEVGALINIMEQAKELDVRGFFVESFWKYLLYTEIARTIDNRIKDNPGMTLSTFERDLINFAADNSNLLTESFTLRLKNALADVDIEGYIAGGGRNTTEYLGVKLHSQMIRALKRKLAPVLERNHTIAILIDNLDKGWESGINVQKVSEVLFGLLSVARQLPDEITQDTTSGKNINLRMTVFLRSDIYTQVLKNARERDKFEVQHIEWSDRSILGQVLDQRLVAEFPERTPDELWNEFFIDQIEGKAPREYTLDCIRPRPRDAIYFLKSAISSAISRSHTKVEQVDFDKALDIYSKWVYDSIIDEDDPSVNIMKDILFEFINDRLEYSESEIIELLSKITKDAELSKDYFNLLFDSHFFEVEYNGGNFRVVDDEEDRERLLVALRRRAQKKGDEVKFRITRPFHRVLYIDNN